jgi:hypothetical protein
MGTDEQPVAGKQTKTELLDKQDVTPRIALFFISIFLNLCASALAGLGPFLNIPQLVIGSTAVWVCWFAIMFAIAIPATDSILREAMGWLKPAAGILVAAIAIFTVVEIAGLATIYISPSRIESSGGEVSQLAKSVIHSFQPADSDALYLIKEHMFCVVLDKGGYKCRIP